MILIPEILYSQRVKLKIVACVFQQTLNKIACVLAPHCHCETVVGVRQTGHKNLSFDYLACFPANVG